MKTNNRVQRSGSGFTILEMMAVVAVVAILSALALPSYQGRIVRKQIETAWPLAAVAKAPVAAAWTATQIMPVDNAAAGLPAADKMVSNYVKGVAVEDGAIHITFGNRAHSAISGKIITLRPAVVADAPIVPVAWVCGKADAPAKMTLKGTNKTSVPDAVLPLDCRSIGKPAGG